MIVLQNIWWLLVLIGVMILIHELGHYWAARFFDVRVEAFSFGFGPRLFGFRRGETDFRVSAILFGGYVKMAGEQPGDEHRRQSAGEPGRIRGAAELFKVQDGDHRARRRCRLRQRRSRRRRPEVPHTCGDCGDDKEQRRYDRRHIRARSWR